MTVYILAALGVMAVIFVSWFACYLVREISRTLIRQYAWLEANHPAIYAEMKKQ